MIIDNDHLHQYQPYIVLDVGNFNFNWGKGTPCLLSPQSRRRRLKKNKMIRHKGNLHILCIKQTFDIACEILYSPTTLSVTKVDWGG